jgi:uncharacterized protein (TIGR03382 family)
VDGGAPADFYLTVEGDAGARIPLSLEADGAERIRLIPGTPLTPGLNYTFHDPDACTSIFDHPDDTFTFAATAAAPLPTTLGELTVTAMTLAPLELAGGAGCSEQITSARADVSLTLSASASPWKDALVYTTWVDGEQWSASADLQASPAYGESWVGRGRDRVYAACTAPQEASPGVPEGQHSVELRAALPGTDLDLRSTSVMVTLKCAGSPDGSTPRDGSPDATPPSDDTKRPSLSQRSTTEPSGNGNCRIGMRRTSSSGSGAVVALAFAALVRRRRVIRPGRTGTPEDTSRSLRRIRRR